MSVLGFADRTKELGTEAAFEVLLKAKQLERRGEKVVHFEIGEPDFDTPENIRNAAIKALNEGYTHYTPAPGLLELREAIAEKVGEDRGIKIDPETEVVVSPGGKPSIFYCILALVNPGDEVLVPDPGFPIYESVVRIAGGMPISFALREENDFSLDAGEVAEKISKKTKLIILSFPNNPCGSNLSPKDTRELAEIASRKGVWVMTDEIYSRFSYEGRCPSIISEPGLKQRTVLVDGFSKAYAMTGWRLGYAVGDRDVIARMVRLQVNICSCAAAFAQKAAVEALRGPQDSVKKMIEEYRRRRDYIVSGLNSVPGFRTKIPKGAFYVLPNVKKTSVGSKQLSNLLLEQAKVGTVDGSAFGKYGDGYIRLSYATSMEDIKEGLSRIKAFMQELKPS